MKRYKDERLNKEMDTIQAKLFRYSFMCFTLMLIIKLYILDYSGPVRYLDYFVFYTTLIYSLILEFRSRSDFYIYTRRSIKRIIIGTIFVGAIVTIIPLKENNFSLAPEYISTYISTFLGGVILYLIVYFLSTKFKQYRHRKFEEKFEEEDE